jgi:branched-chain amino acid transport system ATP-binding protein
MTFLRVEGLSKSFGGLRAVQEISFEVEQGETLGIIGPNGSGKTTTLNLLTGFIKPDSGTVLFKGENVTGLPRYQLSHKGIARTFQLIKPFLQFSALQNVMVGRVYGQSPAKNLSTAAAEAKSILELMGLLGKADVLAKDLTLMERKRLELARALATSPQLLLLDELMAGLNHAEAETAMQLISQIKNDLNLTILIVEHIVKAVVGLSDRVVVLNMGRKIAEDLPLNIIHDPQVIDVYLGKAHA